MDIQIQGKTVGNPGSIDRIYLVGFRNPVIFRHAIRDIPRGDGCGKEKAHLFSFSIQEGCVFNLNNRFSLRLQIANGKGENVGPLFVKEISALALSQGLVIYLKGLFPFLHLAFNFSPIDQSSEPADGSVFREGKFVNCFDGFVFTIFEALSYYYSGASAEDISFYGHPH
ncbi:MAG TPA: hypothetical protein VLL97_05065 [Acidobacteriota bacterium]|nr:hypothetical protein [Acidobacteriota bacterium]